MLVVGLTGGIASGKSTVSKIFSTNHSIPIIDADLLAREVIEPGTSGFSLIVDHFGADRILDSSGLLDRAALGEIIFNDPDERKWLNSVIHPRVRREMVKRTVSYWLGGEWCVIVDVPLLVEAGMWRWVGDVVVVYVNEKLQLSRLISRPVPNTPPLTETQAKARISSQMSLSEKLNYSTYVLDNSGTMKDLEVQIDKLVSKWKVSQGFNYFGWWYKLCWLVPPVGLTAGLMVLFSRWLKYNVGSKKGRRRGRGEVDRGWKPEEIELRERNGRPGGRRRTGGSITDE
ncbi:dephospho-CoA kinase [Kwoniella bestiolae CBS 10118]|uniref:Dephospho-CoA kinase n=1 Tax=Kwoniella bestiolae CBS 10118 TaxID=1296100 RepID=A0A1B9GAD8_9TREE|nr:dephospho-CoA kinase [Kwoniella bestiolae CBS 10118]OCF27983.1 dephospho-CoA kinase [Kwoniella bestiolae CBS 10118]